MSVVGGGVGICGVCWCHEDGWLVVDGCSGCSGHWAWWVGVVSGGHGGCVWWLVVDDWVGV